MKKTLAVVSVVGLLGAAGLVIWSTRTLPDSRIVRDEDAASFDLQHDPEPVSRGPVAESPPQSPRQSLTRPLGLSEPGANATGEARLEAKKARAESLALRHKGLKNLMEAPVRMLAAHSPLASGAELRRFLADESRVNGYLDAALTRVILNRPIVAKAILGNAGVTRAVLASPAMSDPAAVRALLGSKMFRKILDCPGVQGALTDPVVARNLFGDPQTVLWLAGHPQAMQAITDALPALAGQMPRPTGKSRSSK